MNRFLSKPNLNPAFKIAQPLPRLTRFAPELALPPIEMQQTAFESRSIQIAWPDSVAGGESLHAQPSLSLH